MVTEFVSSKIIKIGLFNEKEGKDFLQGVLTGRTQTIPMLD